LDQLVFELGLAESRERAKTTVMAGLVYVNGQKSDKPGTQVSPDAKIEVRGDALPYVSRGGFKLEKALKVFPVDPTGLTCIDCGASTGGFTDCMLQNGARKVYAVDVGYGQLDWKLRTDERVVNLERTNARYLTREQIPEELDFISVDVSFISLGLILPALRGLLRPHGQIVCLVKPQFEAGREKVGKKGVVRDPAVHREVLEQFLTHAAQSGLTVRGLTFSPIRGPEGNIEYLVHLLKREAPEASAEEREDQVSEISGEVLSGEQEMTAAGALSEEMIRRVVKKAHQSLD
jgi:23S rRNA (cytidine1920-2'-O)/16S rRNA (cytidine1409-2'-O)-methyltransferase